MLRARYIDELIISLKENEGNRIEINEGMSAKHYYDYELLESQMIDSTKESLKTIYIYLSRIKNKPSLYSLYSNDLNRHEQKNLKRKNRIQFTRIIKHLDIKITVKLFDNYGKYKLQIEREFVSMKKLDEYLETYNNILLD